jgi:hypothetical protein
LAFKKNDLSLGMKINFNFPDTRLCSRAEHLFSKISETPNRSFPKIFDSPGELLSFYRLINNKRMQVNDFLDPVLNNAVEYSSQCKDLLIAHDTTTAMGACQDKKTHLHLSLAIERGRSFVHGAVNLRPWTREQNQEKKDELKKGLQQPENKKTSK